MKRLLVASSLFLATSLCLANASAQEPAKEKIIFDFEDAADLKAWSNLEPDAKEKYKEPPAKIEFVAEKATSGKHSMKLTFAGGKFPTVTTAQVAQDWLAYPTFQADVTASRPCVVGFAIMQEKSERGGGWEALISRWTKTAFLQAGKNRVTASLPQPNNYALHAKWGKIVRFEIFMFNPREDESIYVDNIRLGTAKLPAPKKTDFTVAGTEWVLAGNSSADAVRELGKKLKNQWAKPTPKSIDQVEAEFKTRIAELKTKYPRAVLAALRDGEKGYDPAQPDKVYAGWKDAYWNSHGPDGAFVARSENRGKAASHEIFMRHRSPLMRVDLASIPQVAEILAAQLIVVRAEDKYRDDHNPEAKATMWVVEPCNRPWEEYEVNAFEYAKGKFWHEIGGMHWAADADFAPTFLAYGPGQGKVNTWDFAAAVRYWTDGKHANHGFMLHGDSHDYITGHTREAKELRDRPAVMVVYNAK
jgi:hypothetical protein